MIDHHLIAREHVLEALAKLDDGYAHTFGRSTDYDLLWNGRRYAPKAVVGVAYELASGKPTRPADFSGGEQAGQANDILMRLGFVVVEKDWSETENEATVDGYFRLYERILDDESVSKADYQRLLQQQLVGRTIKALKRKFENISSYLLELNLPPLKGYVPTSSHRQTSLEKFVDRYLQCHPELEARLREQAPAASRGQQYGQALPPAGPASKGQGFAGSPAERKVVEAYAMAKATAYFTQLGYTVDDVHRTNPYDLHCTRSDGAFLRVEVKGTTTGAASILVTRNEVNLARKDPDHAALFVVYAVKVESFDDGPFVSGGQQRVLLPWLIDDDQLTAIQFSYELPPSTPVDVPSVAPESAADARQYMNQGTKRWHAG